MISLLTISTVFLCVFSLCHGQGRRSFTSSLFQDGPYDSRRGSSYLGGDMGPSYTRAGMRPSYDRGGSSYMGDGVYSYDGGATYDSYRDSSYNGYPPAMGRDVIGYETDRMGGMSRVTDYRDRTRTSRRSDRRGGHGGRSGHGRRGSRGRGGDRGGRGSRGGRDGRCDRSGDGPPREGCIGARGGQGGYPVQGGYCAGGACSDGGASAGVGMGYGTGTQMAMDRRIMTGRNEDIRTYEPFAGGPATIGGMPGMPGGMPGMPGGMPGMPGGIPGMPGGMPGMGGPPFEGGFTGGPFGFF